MSAPGEPLTEEELNQLEKEFRARREGKKQLAIIRNPTYGVNDRGNVWLCFQAHTDENGAAMLGFTQPQADEIIKQADAQDVRRFDGRACWVCLEDGLMRFVRMANI